MIYCSCKSFTDRRISARRAASRQTREAGPKAEILKLLESKGVRNFRMQSGDIVVQVGARRRRIAGNKPGTPDILVFYSSNEIGKSMKPKNTLWVEVKKSDTAQSPEQIEFQAKAEANGEVYLLARSAQDVDDWLERNA